MCVECILVRFQWMAREEFTTTFTYPPNSLSDLPEMAPAVVRRRCVAMLPPRHVTPTSRLPPSISTVLATAVAICFTVLATAVTIRFTGSTSSRRMPQISFKQAVSSDPPDAPKPTSDAPRGFRLVFLLLHELPNPQQGPSDRVSAMIVVERGPLTSQRRPQFSDPVSPMQGRVF